MVVNHRGIWEPQRPAVFCPPRLWGYRKTGQGLRSCNMSRDDQIRRMQISGLTLCYIYISRVGGVWATGSFSFPRLSQTLHPLRPECNAWTHTWDSQHLQMYNTSDSVHNIYWTLDNEISKDIFAVHVKFELIKQYRLFQNRKIYVNVVKLIHFHKL